MNSSPMDVTLLLSSVAAGNREAADQLVPLVYQELKRLASSYMRRERPDHTLQATALVHEVPGQVLHGFNLDSREDGLPLPVRGR